MKTEKYNKFRISKYLFPTKIIAGSGNTKGACLPGYKEARKHLAIMLNRNVDHMKVYGTMSEWVFFEPKDFKRVKKED